MGLKKLSGFIFIHHGSRYESLLSNQIRPHHRLIMSKCTNEIKNKIYLCDVINLTMDCGQNSDYSKIYRDDKGRETLTLVV